MLNAMLVTILSLVCPGIGGARPGRVYWLSWDQECNCLPPGAARKCKNWTHCARFQPLSWVRAIFWTARAADKKAKLLFWEKREKEIFQASAVTWGKTKLSITKAITTCAPIFTLSNYRCFHSMIKHDHIKTGLNIEWQDKTNTVTRSQH